MLEQGEVESKIIAQCMRENLPLPDRIANAPEIIPGLELYFVAFLDLSDSRTIGMGPGPIPWKVVQDYCREFGLDDDQTEEMHHHIKVMDAAYLQHQKRK